MKKAIPSKKYADLLVWLKKARNSRSLTIRDVAERIGRPYQFVSKIETGERRLDVYEYVQYCEALDVDPVQGLNFLKAD